MRTQANTMPWSKEKNHTVELFEIISEEIMKQINKAFGSLTQKISKPVMDQNETISKSTEDTKKRATQLNKMI